MLPAALRLRPDVAVMEIPLPQADGLAVAAQLGERLPSCRAIILTDRASLTYFKSAVRVGVRGFVVKQVTPGELCDGIRRVARGEQVLDPAAVAHLMRVSWSPLTVRETDVLRLLSLGWDTRAIAAELNLSVGTVRNYVTASLSKLGARTRVEAVRIVAENGWV